MTPATWKQHVPEPIFDANPGFIELYWKAWELAWDHVREEPGLPQTPYMEEACWDDTIWIWDTCFMALFTRYAPGAFPGLESLRNFYTPAAFWPMLAEMCSPHSVQYFFCEFSISFVAYAIEVGLWVVHICEMSV